MLSRCIHAISDTKFKRLDLQKGQFIFLTRVCENPGINHVELANLLKADKTTTTKAIQKLIDAGYIRKARDDQDKRMWRLYPEQKGLATYDLVIDEENHNIRVCFNQLTEEEKEQALYLVQKMRENVENDWKMRKTRSVEDD